MSQLKPAVSAQDHVQGSNHATVEIVEFGDYQCPHCGAAYPIVKEIQEAFGSQIKFVFRNFPLSEIHKYERVASLAAEAAALQGKFWEMHDEIFEHQNSLNEQFVLSLADQLGLDLAQFEADLKKEEVIAKVDDDFESGIRSGVNGTPSFFVNGQKFDGGAIDLYQMLKESGE